MTAAELQALIEQRGVHPVFGAAGDGYGIEQSPRELAAFLARMDALGVKSALEIGTGHKAGLARFMRHDMGWRVATLDNVDYGHKFEGIDFITPNGLTPLPSSKGMFDLVFIDGNHSYPMVMLDHKQKKILASKAIAFHDIAGLRECEGAQRYWREIAYDGDNLRAGYHEAIDGDKPAGIGWIEL